MSWIPLITLATIPIASIVAFQHLEQSEKVGKFLQALQYCEKANKPLLNVGCGENVRILGDVNIDISAEAILPDYQQGSIYDLPFNDKHFGAVCCFSTIEHLEDPKRALEEMKRVADRVYVTVPYPLDFSQYLHPDHRNATFGAKNVRFSGASNLIVLGTLCVGAGMIYLSRKS